MKRFYLVPVMLRLPADVSRLRGRLAELTHRDLDQYLSLLHQQMTGGEQIDDVLLSHVATVATLPKGARLSQAQEESVAAIRAHPEEHWRVTDLKQLAEAVRPHAAALADHYAGRAEARRPGPPGPPRKFSFFGRRTAPASADPPDTAPSDAPPSDNSRKRKGR